MSYRFQIECLKLEIARVKDQKRTFREQARAFQKAHEACAAELTRLGRQLAALEEAENLGPPEFSPRVVVKRKST